MEYEKLMCHIQRDMQLTHCDSKTKQDGISGSDVPHANRYATYILCKTGWNIRK
jgi:hypothetical protein